MNRKFMSERNFYRENKDLSSLHRELEAYHNETFELIASVRISQAALKNSDIDQAYLEKDMPSNILGSKLYDLEDKLLNLYRDMQQAIFKAEDTLEQLKAQIPLDE